MMFAGLTLLIDGCAIVFVLACGWVILAVRYPVLERALRVDTAMILAIVMAGLAVMISSSLRFVRMEG